MVCVHLTTTQEVQNFTLTPLNTTIHFTSTLPLFKCFYSKTQNLVNKQNPTMAVGLLAAVVPKPFCLLTTKLQPSSLLTTKPAPLFAPLGTRHGFFNGKNRRKINSFTVCFVLEEKKQSTQIETFTEEEEEESGTQISTAARVAEKLARKRSERFTYLVAAVMSSFGITSMAVMAVYYRFWWQMEVLQTNHTCPNVIGWLYEQKISPLF